MNPTAVAYTSAMRDLAEKRAAEETKIEKEYNVGEIYKNQPLYTKASAWIGKGVDWIRSGLNTAAKAVDHGIRGIGETTALNLNEKAQEWREKGGWLKRNIGARLLDATAWTASEASHFASITVVKLPRVAATIVNFAAHGTVNIVKDGVFGSVERLFKGKEKMRALESDKLARIFGMNPDDENDQMWKALHEMDAQFPGMKIKILRDLLAINNEAGDQKMIKEYTDEEHEEFAFSNPERQKRKQDLLNKYKTADEKGWKHTLVSEKSKQERPSLNLSGGVLGLLTMVDTMTDSLAAAHHTSQRGPRNFLAADDIKKYIGLLQHQHLDETLRSKTDKDRETASSFLSENLDRDIIPPALQSDIIQNLEVKELDQVTKYLKIVPDAFEILLKKISQEKAGQQDRLEAFAEFKKALMNPSFTSEVLTLKQNHALNQLLTSIQSQFLEHAEAAMSVDYTESTSPRYQSSEIKEGLWENVRRTGIPYAAGRIIKTKWSFVAAKSVLAHSGLMAGGVAAAGANSAAAFMNPTIAVLAGVSVLKDAVGGAMYNGAVQEMLKENDRAHLKELTQLYTGRTMFGESIPEDLTKMLAELRTLSAIDQSSLTEEALKEFTSKETALRDKYETRYGSWILN